MPAVQKQIRDELVYGSSKELEHYFTFDYWIEFGLITEEDKYKYPEAKKAADLMNSKLYKALK